MNDEKIRAVSCGEGAYLILHGEEQIGTVETQTVFFHSRTTEGYGTLEEASEHLVTAHQQEED